ncbi:hypothetical protein E2C01_054525 [Portunus trituberculatus]|uniref:Uncharacterized protein n=2 Tax=Portunus trituberculatus TaxID=210409 RepID=A0A5B7GJT9_PORTR|nr:hypothetical protein [Portunus trituberculatus]
MLQVLRAARPPR